MTTDFEGTAPSACTPREWRTDPRWSTATGVPAEGLADRVRSRVVVVAAHPDDESLGAAGLMSLASRSGREVLLVLATAGEASHPDAATTTSALGLRRREESARALQIVAPGSPTTFLRIPDGHVAEHEEQISAALVRIIGDGRDCTVVSPWREDGHPDHEAMGRATAVAARRTGADHWEYPVWWWHWSNPERTPWEDTWHVELDDTARRDKAASIAAHVSQVSAWSDRPGEEALLSVEVLEHFAGASETFFRLTAADEALDRLHAEESDPWGVDSDWYEIRKRRLLIAMLPRPRFALAFELGCSTGALAVELAQHCRRVVAVDSSPAAVARATERVADRDVADRVQVEQRDLAAEWPRGKPDLVVVSELAYFLSHEELDLLRHRIEECVAPGGVVALCHWRHRIDGWPLSGPAVHRYFRDHSVWSQEAHYLDEDVEISLFCASETMPVPRQ